MSDIDLSARSVEWAKNPDPPADARDPQTIVEAEPIAYVWNAQNEVTEWLHFEGETIEVKR